MQKDTISWPIIIESERDIGAVTAALCCGITGTIAEGNLVKWYGEAAMGEGKVAGQFGHVNEVDKHLSFLDLN